MAEAQAVDRVHRIGQQQDVEVVRYIVDDSIESVSPSLMTVPLGLVHRLLTYTSQYIQWVQRDKLRLITDSLSTSELKVENINEERWKVSSLAPRVDTKTLTNPIEAFKLSRITLQGSFS